MLNILCRAVMAALLPLAFLLAFPVLAGASPAASDPLIQITPTQASTFFSAFTVLSQQAKVTIVAEDQPLYPTLAASRASTHRMTAPLVFKKDGEPLSVLLPKIAAAYDYDVQLSGKVFLLKKRYTDAADLPSITVKECALALEEVNRYADLFNPPIPDGILRNSPMMKDLVYSLTPEQLEAMKDIKQGVPVASLTPEHQQEVWAFLLHFYVQRPITDLPDTIGALNRITTSDPRFSWRSCADFRIPQFTRDYGASNTRLFGYDAVLPNGQNFFITLSKPDQIKTFLPGGIRLSPKQEAGVPPVPGRFAPGDLTDPAPVSPNTSKPDPPVSASLSEIIARLNTRAADSLKVAVEPYLAPKRATVFGEALTTPKQELDALADVYNLRVLDEEKVQGKERLRLTRLTAQVPLDVIALHTAILQSLPDPLVRACHKHPQNTPFDPAAPESPMPSDVSPLLIFAVKQIRSAAEPKIRTSKTGYVALSALSEQEERAFAVTLMVDTMESLSAWTTAELPKEVTHFNDLRLSGGLYEQKGKKQMDLLLALPNPNDPSTLLQGPGVGQINYDPVNQTL